MSQQRITEALSSLFSSNPIVFWHDADGEFAFSVEALKPPEIDLLDLDRTPWLQVKIELERAGRGRRFLLYSAKPEPDPASDWLLDVRLRSKPFRADSASILLEDLGLISQQLRMHLKARSKFLSAKVRVDRLKKWVTPNDDADDLDRKMIAVLVKADQPELPAILLRLFTALLQDGVVGLDAVSKLWTDVVANDLDEAFWLLVAREMGYQDVAPTLRDLLFRILVSDFARTVSGSCPAQLSHFILGNKTLAANASVFASGWRSHMQHFGSYDALSSAVGRELGLAHLIAGLSAEDLAETMTFEEVERRIIQDIKGRIISGGGAVMDSMHLLIARRRDGHWANKLLAHSSPTTQALAACYDALEAAAAFFELKAKFDSGFSFANAEAGLESYQTELFRFDQLYRQFNHAADAVEPMGWALLHELRERIENGYSGWFVPQLGSAWSKVLEGDGKNGGGLLSSWKVGGWTNQQDFYNRHVKVPLDAGIKRVFVIISDAFRFEAAEELVRDINGKSRFKAALTPMLGVLPSYTALGMAALLPHETLSYKQNGNLDLATDGSVVSTVEQRSDQLGKHQGVAIKTDDLLALGKDKGREFVRDQRVIYVYHDKIDLLGDKQGSEQETFDAVAQTLIELNQLATFIINSLNGSLVLITADHGFLYQDSPLDEADKSTLGDKPEGTLKAKKRYLLGQGIGASPKAWCGNTSVTAGTTPGDGSMDFWVPRGAARFHFAGGARFVHGSAMPQEIVIPVITLRESENESAKTRAVDLSLLGSSNKVVTNKQRFEFIQTEPVSERVLPRTVLVSLRDGETLISDELSVTFDSTSGLLDERKRSVMLTVKSGSYDKTKDHFLIARDAQTKVEVVRIPLKVDLAFANDF
ncbi:BREX-1 system phosphatase PglZ type A [Propionivibrio sp.]|uniref:BREX-1 system phosphatase PglZ type A n=1 Tax=Propionivibrio sp. TaxID=2212460 RepID=UPI003BF3994F